jgi:hypothetical protein
VWGILALQRGLRKLIHDAALTEGLDPDRLSFTHTVKIVRRQVVRRATFPLRKRAAIPAAVIAEVLGPETATLQPTRGPPHTVHAIPLEKTDRQAPDRFIGIRRLVARQSTPTLSMC